MGRVRHCLVRGPLLASPRSACAHLYPPKPSSSSFITPSPELTQTEACEGRELGSSQSPASSSPSPPDISRMNGFPYLPNQFLPIQLGASCSLPSKQPKLFTVHSLEIELLSSGIVLLSFYSIHISLFWPNVLSLS